MDDRAFASAIQLSTEIRDRRIGCVELLDFYLARAERYNPVLNAIVVWQVEQARERARAADAALARGERWGPLHGIPMTVKESFNVAGLPTTFGNPLWKTNIATDNAFLIDRLLHAGAIVFGKTNVPYMLRWHRSGFRLYWRCKSRRRVGRPAVPTDIRDLIRTISHDNPLWGAPRIHGELLKLGIDIAQSTVAKYMSRRHRPRSPRLAGFPAQ